MQKNLQFQVLLPDFCQINCVCLEYTTTIIQSDKEYVKMLDYLQDSFSINF